MQPNNRDRRRAREQRRDPGHCSFSRHRPVFLRKQSLVSKRQARLQGEAVSPESFIRVLSAFIFAGLIPLAILISRDRLRHYRRGLLISLEDWIYKHADPRPMPSFEIARIKYELSPRAGTDQSNPESASHNASEGGHNEVRTRDSWASYALPAVIYAALSGLGFVTALL
jgi:hypothetical protein